MDNMNNQNIDIYMKSAENAHAVFGGMVIFFIGCIVLLSAEVQTAAESSLFLNAHVWYMRLFGFVFMYVSAYIMTAQWIVFVRKLPGLNSFAERRSAWTIPAIAFGLTLMIIVLGWIMAFVPYIGYIFAILFAFGYFSLAKKLSQSKSGVAKLFFILMMLLVFLILFAVVVFMYLTRPG